MISKAIRCSRHLKKIDFHYSFPKRYQYLVFLNQTSHFSSKLERITYEEYISKQLNDKELDTFIHQMTVQNDFHLEHYPNLEKTSHPQLLTLLKIFDSLERGYKTANDFHLHAAFAEYNEKGKSSKFYQDLQLSPRSFSNNLF